MRAGTVLGVTLFAAMVAGPGTSVFSETSATYGSLCLDAADRIDDGETLTATEKEDAHQACLKALNATGSILQKYQFHEADFTITGKRHDY